MVSGVDPGHREDEAAQAFEAKFGDPPEEIREVAGLLMLGPVW